MLTKEETMSQVQLIIKNALVVIEKPSGELVEELTDIVVDNGLIVDIGSSQKYEATEVYDASHLHVLPGLIDTQVHLREPGLEHKETIELGLKGAALGGITGVFEMPNTTPPTDNAEMLQQKLTIAAKTPWSNFAFFMGATPNNIEQLVDLEKLDGCCGVKVFMGSSTGSLLISELELLERVLKSGQRRVAVHCEDETLLIKNFKDLDVAHKGVEFHPTWRSEEVAFTATKNLLNLSQKTKRKVHVLHITSQKEIEFLHKNKNELTTVECTPQHLTLSAPECYETLGSKAQMNPPIRTKEHREALWAGIHNGTVDVIGSDHAPHLLEEKNRPYPKSPSGMTGVQTTVPIMLNHINEGRLSLIKLVELMAQGPARIYGIQNKGAIKIGNDADFTIVDLKKQRVIKDEWIVSKCGWTPFHNKKVIGWPRATVVNGTFTMKDDCLIQPSGKAFNFTI